jgi:hypothetical protein
MPYFDFAWKNLTRVPATAAAANNTAPGPTRMVPLPFDWFETTGNDVATKRR